MSAEALIRQEILRWGPLPFSRFIELALYHPRYGYYMAHAHPRGRAGDYFTSMQVTSLFPRIMARVVAALRAELDAGEFAFIEAGSGSGEFLEALILAMQAEKTLSGMRIYSIEKSALAREHLKRRLSRFPKCHVVASWDDIDHVGGLEGCLFSNELIDALPFHRMRYTRDGWKEIGVGLDQGRFVDVCMEPSDPRLCAPLESGSWADGQECEVRLAVEDWVDEAAAHFTRGTWISVDYGYPRQELYSSRRMKGTWQCYHRHRVHENPYQYIGAQDITAHVDFTQWAQAGLRHGLEPAFFGSQGLFLSYTGQDVIKTLLQSSEGARYAGAVKQLLHPDAMGSAFQVLIQTKSAALPATLAGIPNRIKRLSL